MEADVEGEGIAIKAEIDSENKKICPDCGYEGEMNEELVMGCVGWSWLGILLLLTVILFFVPFFCKYCKDKRYNCPKCGTTTEKELARCL